MIFMPVRDHDSPRSTRLHHGGHVPASVVEAGVYPRSANLEDADRQLHHSVAPTGELVAGHVVESLGSDHTRNPSTPTVRGELNSPPASVTFPDSESARPLS